VGLGLALAGAGGSSAGRASLLLLASNSPVGSVVGLLGLGRLGLALAVSLLGSDNLVEGAVNVLRG